jgi:hypothetical protein
VYVSSPRLAKRASVTRSHSLVKRDRQFRVLAGLQRGGRGGRGEEEREVVTPVLAGFRVKDGAACARAYILVLEGLVTEALRGHQRGMGRNYPCRARSLGQGCTGDSR